MSVTTYSFQDNNVSFNHPFGNASSTGAGIGTISVAMTQTKTTHDVGADGSVMISKIEGDNGTIAITIQQTSQLHKYLKNWYNYINTSADTSQWASMAININNKSLGDNVVATNVSPQKMADQPYQAQGQMVTWNLMAAKITMK